MAKTIKQVVKAKGTRTARSPEYRAAALVRAGQIGVGATASELAIVRKAAAYFAKHPR